MADKNPVVDCTYSLFDEGRKYSGHHRKYVLENARELCYSPATRENINLRECFGYLGHGRRLLAGKLNLDEVEAVKLPDGRSMIVENIPSNITTAFDIKSDGTIQHRQEFLLANAPGRKAWGLHQDKIGGFSWAMGRAPGVGPETRLNSFNGFDYVLKPGFAHNRGYVFESAEDMDIVLESIERSGATKAEARQTLESLVAGDIFLAEELRRQLEDAQVFEAALMAEKEELKKAAGNMEAAILKAKEVCERREKLVMEAAGKTAIVVPEDVLHAILNPDTKDAVERIFAVFEKARAFDPAELFGHHQPGATVPAHSPAYAKPGSEPPEYGSGELGAKLFRTW